jgi:hypothetical protein
MLVIGSVWQTDRLTFYGYSPFPLNVHGVENLVFKITVINDSGGLDKAIG